MNPGRDRLLLFAKGMAMGAADSVPGVSGGTIALITNIYEELVDTIRSIDWQVLVTWKREGLSAAWKQANGNFLLTLLAGMVTSLLLLGRVILSLMDNYLPYLLAFFAGLVVASIFYIGRRIRRWDVVRGLLLIAGAVFALCLSILPLREADTGLLFYFCSGAIAICAMILPGISGAFILVLLGAYGPILEALTAFDWQVIAMFVAGCALGLMLFSRLLSWLLHHRHESTMATLTGMLAGSLFLLWPWRIATEIVQDNHGFTHYEPVLPGSYAEIMGQAFSPWGCLFLFVLGAVLVLLLERVAGDNNTHESIAVD